MSGRFVNFAQYLSANRDNAEKAAGTMGDAVDGYAGAAQTATQAVRDDTAAGNAPSGAQSSLYPGAVSATQRATSALENTATPGGRQYELEQAGVSASTMGGNRFNAGLTGTVGRERSEAQRSRYAGLQDALSGAATLRPVTSAPVRPPEQKPAGYGRVTAPARSVSPGTTNPREIQWWERL